MNSWKLRIGCADWGRAKRGGVVRCAAMASIEWERSRAFIIAILRGVEGERSFRVLRPVPQPSSVIVIAFGVAVVGVSEERAVKAWVRRDGSSWSSIAWRMLPSVS